MIGEIRSNIRHCGLKRLQEKLDGELTQSNCHYLGAPTKNPSSLRSTDASMYLFVKWSRLLNTIFPNTQ